jgi:hypothetical protein
MKINKLKPAVNSSILSEQARILSEAPRSNSDDYLQLEAGEGARRALAALEAEDVEPVTEKLKIIPGTIANPEPLNKFLSSAEDDLRSLYGINQSIRKGMLARYNSIATKEANIIGNLKTLRDRLSTLKLYSRNIASDNQYITFTFSDGQQIGLPDSANVATYSEEEGALLLPIETGSVTRPEIAKVEIVSEDSTGTPGNNSDKTRPRNLLPEVVLDGQTHSWFEYERIQNVRGDELRLALRFTLKEPSVVNRIRIDPVNFGTRAWVRIEDIKIQTEDGIVSVKSDISTTSWDADQDPFQLSPATSKYAGQGLYTFSPVMAKTIQITFIQSEPYSVENGGKLRYAIGLREIDILQVPFMTEGDFLLKPVVFKSPVRTIGLLNNIAPYNPKFVTMSYEVSTDGGVTWLPISPLENVDFNKKEALTFEDPIQSLILKGKIVRDNSNFEQKLPKDLIKDAELLTSISSPSTRISLESKPDSYLELIQIGLGCAGDLGHPLFLGTVSSREEAQVFYLPSGFSRDRLRVLVNGESWPILDSFEDASTTGILYDETSTPPQLVFGDGSDDGLKGRVPPIGAEVYAYLDVDKKAIFSGEGPYYAELSTQSDKIRETTRVTFRDLAIKTGTVYAGPGQSFVTFPENHHVTQIMSVDNGVAYEPIFAADTFPETIDQFGIHFEQYGFRNGRFEFITVEGNLYGTDWSNGKLYFSPANNNQQQMVVTYTYIERLVLEDDEWKYHPTENKIIIISDRFTPRTEIHNIAEDIEDRAIYLTEGLDPFHYNGVTLVKGSIVPIDITGSGLHRVLENEVPFINGATEFISLQQDNLEGFYSVDYRNGIIFLPPGITFPAGKIRFMYVAAEISYGFGRKLNAPKDYTANELVADLTPSFIHTYSETARNRPDRSKLLVRYDYRPGTTIQDPDRARFYSPVLRDITIVGVGADPRLGTLESL